jgi:hypothetical protein
LPLFFNVTQEGEIKSLVENSRQTFIPLLKGRKSIFIISSLKGKQIIYSPKLEYNPNEIRAVIAEEGTHG